MVSPPHHEQQLLLTGRPLPRGPPIGRLVMLWEVGPHAWDQEMETQAANREMGEEKSFHAVLRQSRRWETGNDRAAAPRGDLPAATASSPLLALLLSFHFPPSYTHRTRSVLGVARYRAAGRSVRVPTTATVPITWSAAKAPSADPAVSARARGLGGAGWGWQCPQPTRGGAHLGDLGGGRAEVVAGGLPAAGGAGWRALAGSGPGFLWAQGVCCAWGWRA